MAAGGDEYGYDGIGRSFRADCGQDSAEGSDHAEGSLCADFGNHLLHAARRLVRISMCDNFGGSGGGAVCVSRWALVDGRPSFGGPWQRLTTSDQRLVP